MPYHHVVATAGAAVSVSADTSARTFNANVSSLPQSSGVNPRVEAIFAAGLDLVAGRQTTDSVDGYQRP